MRGRCAEEREDAVTGRLHDVPVVAMDSVDHQLKRRVDDRPRLLRVEVLHQLRRALDVGEQRRHRLALTLERRRGFLRNEAHRGRRLRCGCLALGNSSIAVKRGGALAAEIESRGIIERAVGAGQPERSSALSAELHAGWILKFALRAAHRQSLRFPQADARVSPEHRAKETASRARSRSGACQPEAQTAVLNLDVTC